MSAPPGVEPRTEPAHDDDIRVSNFGWWALGGALGTAITVGLAFVVLIAMTSETERTNAMPEGGGAAAVEGEAVSAITLVATEFAFDPDRFVAAPEVEVTLDNQGLVIHNFVVEGVPEADFAVVADAGAVAAGTVTLAPGNYVFFCSIPGHREAGMEGLLTVAAG